MRILLFSGKGGVEKTSLADATGLQLATALLVMSVGAAHSLADAFDLGLCLFHTKTGAPTIDEIKRHWREISSCVISVLRTTGISRPRSWPSCSA